MRSTRARRVERAAGSGVPRWAMSERVIGGMYFPESGVTFQPEARLIADELPAAKRACDCGQPLPAGQGRCPRCGRPFSFVAVFRPGEMVAGRYDVKGTLAFGALGWIYLADDRALRRYVVFKGLLNARDANLAALAAREREIMAALDHPKIVKIFDVLSAKDQTFAVMEYVPGRSLIELRRSGGPIAPAAACAYINDVLPAFAYLDRLDLVYNDVKPHNIILAEAGTKLIDLGSVRRVGHPPGEALFSIGFGAPEAWDAPSPLSDIYGLGRTLAVLVAEFEYDAPEYEHAIPSPADCPVFAEHRSLYELILKATQPDPDDRFQTAEEMAIELGQVLREIAPAGSLVGE